MSETEGKTNLAGPSTPGGGLVPLGNLLPSFFQFLAWISVFTVQVDMVVHSMVSVGTSASGSDRTLISK